MAEFHPVDILIVEDSETQAEQLQQLLLSEGFKVRVASNGQEALVQARANKPALVVSDIAMPVMDGFAMCRELKKDRMLRDVPVILLTALTSLYDVIKGLDCGADNFIRKPFEGRYLIGRIRFMLANRELRSNERVQLGMRINLGGQTHFVTAERQQIFDLLISTYEEAIQMTEELRAQQNRIAHSYQSLVGLYKIAEALNPALTETKVSEMALERALDLPGILGGCIKLLDAAGRFHVAAARDFGRLAQSSEECGDCSCQQMLVAGELRGAKVVTDCKPLGDGLVHVSIPLAVGGRTLGVLNLASTSSTPFDAEDLQVLETVGNQIAIALERAHLYTHMETLVGERTEALQAERNRLSAIVNTTGALVLSMDSEGRICEFNPSCEHSLGWKLPEVAGRYFWEVYESPEQVPTARALFEQHVRQGVTTRLQREWLARDGSRRVIIWSAATLRRADQSIERVIATGIDVTEHRLAEEQVQYLSNFDVVTGLPNRILLRDQARLAMDRARAGRDVMGLLLICFSHMQQIRANLSEKTEQALLKQIAERLRSWAVNGEAVARFAESTFAVIVLRQSPDELAAVARQLLSLLGEPFIIGDQELHMDMGIGITMCPNDGEDFDLLCQGAETAMRRAADEKQERYEFYRPELNVGARDRFKLDSELRRALVRGEFVLHYQPKVSLSSGDIVGLEALLRWRHPELGLLGPTHFIGLAEETGLILPIGEWVLHEACEQIRSWQQAGVATVPVAVNLSAKQFSTKITETVADILQQTGIDPGLLELELTESVSMVDPENTVGILRKLKNMGVGLAIDDFGTGYSNLNYLKRFPVDRIKLDQSFVRELTSNPDDLAISRAVIVMAHSLRLMVIAEGVETEGQLAVLAQNGCDEMQGYLFSRPVDADSCAVFLKKRKSLDLKPLLSTSPEWALLMVEDATSPDVSTKAMLSSKGYKVFVTDTPAQAFELLATEKIGVVLCDQRLPGMSGTEFLERIRQMYPEVVRMLSSDYAELQSAIDVAERGVVFRSLHKPWEKDVLLEALGDAFDELSNRKSVLRGEALR